MSAYARCDQFPVLYLKFKPYPGGPSHFQPLLEP